MKGLFNLFVGHILKVACQLLDKNNSKHHTKSFYGKDKDAIEKSTLLLGYIMGCIHRCLQHDTETFVTAETITLMTQPIVDQASYKA